MSANQPNRPSNNQRLAQQLRNAAFEERPAFDEKLHVRILEAVDPWRNPVAIYREPPQSRLRRLTSSPWLAAATAASVMLAVGVYALNMDRPAPQAARITHYNAAEWLLPVAMPEHVREEALVEHSPPISRGAPSMMALAVTDPLKGFTLRTSQLPIAAAARLGRLREANNRFAAELVRDQLASLDQDARVAANMLLGSLPRSEAGNAVDEPPLEQ